MSFNVFLPSNIIPLSDSIVYDEETQEVLMSFDRFTMSFTTEEFSFLSNEISDAADVFKTLLINKVQNNSSQEMN